MWLTIVIALSIIGKCRSISSPIPPLSDLKYSTEVEKNLADLWWSIDESKGEILFEFHVKTTGWISLGISPGGGMKGADIGVGWIDQRGSVHFQDRYAFDFARPIIDNTTNDWVPLKGRESNGWTAIHFKRLLDTCDPMDYPIKSGTNILIYAYGLTDPENSEIRYHENRRGTRMVPLKSYSQPPSDDKFANLDYFDLRFNNYVVPSSDTTYHCKVYKAPTTYSTKRHAIGYQVLIDDNNLDLVHHLLLHECSPTVTFDDENLPDGVCDDIAAVIESCLANIATGWAVGGDRIVEFVEEAGYPLGLHSPNKYLMVQMHYDNPKRASNRRDSSGLRFYLGNELRQHDLGYLTFGTLTSLTALAIPPKVEQFIVDSYCPSTVTKNFPQSGLTIFAAFPHTHFKVQGDEFATRCVYNTMNKNETTLGGEKTNDEMCLHFFTYYPRMDNFSACYTMNTIQSLTDQINSSSEFNFYQAKQWFIQRKWTPELSQQWQLYYNNASRMTYYTEQGRYHSEYLGILPKYEDLPTTQLFLA